MENPVRIERKMLPVSPFNPFLRSPPDRCGTKGGVRGKHALFPPCEFFLGSQ
jgi:hypothetical protein